MLIRTLSVLAMSVALIGCGGAKGGGDSEVVVPQIPTPITIQSLHILPGDTPLDLDQVAVLTASATMSDGTHQVVSATWSTSDALVASIDSLTGTTVTVKGLSQGTSTIEAAYDAFNATLEVTVAWATPTDPGPICAADSTLSIALWPADGNGNPSTIYAPFGAGGCYPNGMAMNPAGTQAYMIYNNGATDCRIYRGNVQTTGGALATTIPDWCESLVCDPQGRVYTQSYYSGSVYRFDPSTGAVATIGNIGGGVLLLALGTDDSPCSAKLFTPAGQAWITKLNTATNTSSGWANIPAELSASWGVVPGGLAINRLGEAFISTMSDPMIFRAIDANGDGDATDASEMAKFADLPAHPAWPNSDQIVVYGLAATRGGGVMANILDINDDGSWDPTIAAVRGLWWCKPSTAPTRYSSKYVYGGDGGCIAAPR